MERTVSELEWVTLHAAADRMVELETKLCAIRDVIPMNFLQRHDVGGASGPTDHLNLVAAVRDLVEQGRKWEAKARELPAFVAAYDLWRVAADAVGSLPDDEDAVEYARFCDAEAAAEAALINLRNDLQKSAV